MKKLSFMTALAAVLLISGIASAQEAPTPNRAPRAPVNRQQVVAGKPVIAPSTVVQGTATILDSERIRMGDIDMRLFGVVPPQLSATLGPQARSFLDNLVLGQTVSCVIRDRDQSGRFLATCRNGENNDIALELLKRGLAVTARGSLASTDLLTPYINAEQAAQAQKIGLWSGAVPQAAKVEAAAVAVPAALPAPTPIPPVSVETKKEDRAAVRIDQASAAQVQEKVASAAMAASSLSSDRDMAAVSAPATGFFARYQLMITGIIMLITALSIMGVITAQQRREKSDERKAVAAALRGELMAARAVCQGRLKLLNTEADEKAVTWPRVRATLYQAYVGRLGFLGAELARQVASIYGQASDYAAYYNTAGEDVPKDGMPKRQALQTLVTYIEEVLPKLATIELTGHLIAAHPTVPPLHRPVTTHNNSYDAPVAAEPAYEAKWVKPVAAPASASIHAPAHTHEESPVEQAYYGTRTSDSKSEAKTEAPKHEASSTARDEDNAQQKASSDSALHEAEAAQEIVANHSQDHGHAPAAAAPSAAVPSASHTAPAAASTSALPPTPPTAEIVEPGPGKAPLWDTVRKFARNRFSDIRPEVQEHDDHDADNDYASLIEDDMANMSFSDMDEEDTSDKLPDHLAKMRHTGS